ncbi:MAG TPA: flagellar basal body protein FliL [Thermotoga sp.]|nr:flagellar basal body protein FliL [Thermotoga sp.]
MPEEEAGEKKKGIGGLLTSIIVPLVVSIAVYFTLPMFLGSNKTGKEEEQQQVQPAPVEIKAVLIQPGTYQTFMLKGGKEVAVIDSLSFKVGSDACRAAIAEKKDEIMDALMMIFMGKERSELSTVTGVELLKRQIREAVNTITGFIGDKEKYGVISVFLYIKAFSSVE